MTKVSVTSTLANYPPSFQVLLLRKVPATKRLVTGWQRDRARWLRNPLQSQMSVEILRGLQDKAESAHTTVQVLQLIPVMIAAEFMVQSSKFVIDSHVLAVHSITLSPGSPSDSF